MNTAPLKEGESVTLWFTYRSLYLLSVNQVSVERVGQYIGGVKFYCGSSISWQINYQSVAIAMVMCWQCIGKPLVEFQWGIERWCISWQSATPIQPHPQCFALCYKVPVRWHAEDPICSLHLLAVADTRLISYQIVGFFMYWPTSRSSVGRHISYFELQSTKVLVVMSIKCQWSVGDSSVE